MWQGTVHIAPSNSHDPSINQSRIAASFIVDDGSSPGATLIVENTHLILDDDYLGNYMDVNSGGDVFVLNSTFEIKNGASLNVNGGAFSVQDNSHFNLWSSSLPSLVQLNGGLFETECTLSVEGLDYVDGPGVYPNASLFNANIIFNGGTLRTLDDFTVSNPLFTFHTKYHILGSTPDEHKIPHIYVSGHGGVPRSGAIIDTNGYSVDFASNIDVDGSPGFETYGGVKLEHYPDPLVPTDGGLTKTDSGQLPGTLKLFVENTYNGGTEINRGTLDIYGDRALGVVPGSTEADNVIFTGDGTLQAGAEGIALDEKRGITISKGVTGTFHTQGYTMTLEGVISGSGSMAKDGAGILDLHGNTTSKLYKLTLFDGTIRNGTIQAMKGFDLYQGEISANLRDSGTAETNTTLRKLCASTLAKLSGSDNRLHFTSVIAYAGTLWIAGTLTCRSIQAGTLDIGGPIPPAIDPAGKVAVTGTVTIQSSALETYDRCQVLGVTSSDSGCHTIGDTILIDIAFDSIVSVSGTPRLNLATGTDGRYATYQSGSGSAILTFAYTVQWGDHAADLDYLGTEALDVNGGSIRDAYDINVEATLPAPGTAGSLSVEADIAIETHLYWDPAGVSGGDGVWDYDSADTYWHLGSPTGPLVPWMNGADAVFGACGDTPGAIYLEDYQDPNGPIIVHSITFLENGYSLVGLTEYDTLSLAEEGMTIDVEEGSATIACKLVDAALSDAALVKTGEGTLILFGEEEYTGDTVISEGTLQLGNGATDGSIAGNITLSQGNLLFNNNSPQTYGGVISGAGSVTKAGSGMLTLVGTNTYSGDTKVTGGELRFTSDTGNTPLINVEAGKVVLATTNVNKPTLHIQTETNGTFQVLGGSHVVGNVSGTGTTDVNGQLTAFDIRQNTLTIQPDAKVALTPSAAFDLRLVVDMLDIQGTSATRGTLDIDSGGMIVKNDTCSHIKSLIVEGGNFDTGWWDGRGITSLAAKEDPNTSMALGIAAISEGFDSFFGMTLPSNEDWVLVRYTLFGDSDMNGQVDATDYDLMYASYGISPTTWVNGDYTYDGVTNWDDYQILTFNYGQSLSSTLYWDADGAATSATGGAGTWNPEDTQAYWRRGSSTGSLMTWAPGSNAVFEGTAGTVMLTDPTEVRSLDFETDGYALTGQSSDDMLFLMMSGTTVEVNSGSATLNCKLANPTLGDGSLIKTGSGTLILAEQNTYSGDTTVNDGTLSLGANNVLPDSSEVTINGGTLAIGAYSDTVAAVHLLSGAITGTTGTLTSTSAYDVQSGTVSAKLGGTVGLTKTGTGTVILTGENTFTGDTNINAGTLQIGTLDGSAGSLAGGIHNNANLKFASAVDHIFANDIDGIGSLTLEYEASQTLRLTGGLSYTGDDIILSGTLIKG